MEEQEEKIKPTAKERRRRILEYLKVGGVWRVSRALVQEMAERYKVSERTIYDDIKKILLDIPKPKVDEVARRFMVSWDYAIDKAIKLMNSTDEEISLKGTKLYFEAVEKYTNFLHQYGFKEQVAEKHHFEGLGGTFILETNSVEDIKNAKKTKDKSEAGRDPESS